MAILATNQAIEIYRGETKNLKLSVRVAGALDIDGVPVPVVLTNAEIIFSVKIDESECAPLIQKRSSDAAQITITSETGGKATIHLQVADTIRLDPGVYVYDIWVWFSTGERYLIVGPADFEIKMPVTFKPL